VEPVTGFPPSLNRRGMGIQAYPAPLIHKWCGVADFPTGMSILGLGITYYHGFVKPFFIVDFEWITCG